MILLQEGGPLPGPQIGLLSNTRKWIVQGHTCADKQEILLGKGAQVESRREGNPGEQLCHMARSLEFSGDGISFQVFFSRSFYSRVLPGDACPVQPRWMPARRILGGGPTCGVSF